VSTTIVAKKRRFAVIAILFHRPRAVEKSHGNRRAKKGDPASRNVADIIRRVEEDNAKAATFKELARIAALSDLPTQPLLRLGQPAVVFSILGGRGLVERVDRLFQPDLCVWCEDEPQGDTTVRIVGTEEQTECCDQPQCYYAALRWVNDQDPTSDRDLIVELAPHHAPSIVEPAVAVA
jgi:hypothetical protein